MQTFNAKQYLQIDIANNMGHDKLNWNDRIEWFNSNEHQLLKLLPKAEKPALYFAGVQAWEATKNKKATGYPVSLDATSSGIQILSVLAGDEQAAKLSNVVDTGHRSDAYTALYEAMKRRTGSKAKYGREDLKRAVMTSYYGSEQVPRDVFGEGVLLDKFFETLEQETPYIWSLNKAFLKFWDPEALKYSWAMPDNFHVHIKVMGAVQDTVKFLGEEFTTTKYENRPQESGRSLGANVTHSVDGFVVRELVRRCNFEPGKKKTIQSLLLEGPGRVKLGSPNEKDLMVLRLWQLYEESGYLSSRILDYLDAGNLGLTNPDTIQDMINSLPEKPFRIIPVHDCFRVHPNYGNDLRKQYNLQMSLIAKSNMLQHILTQLLNKKVEVTKQADLSQAALNANYALS